MYFLMKSLNTSNSIWLYCGLISSKISSTQLCFGATKPRSSRAERRDERWTWFSPSHFTLTKTSWAAWSSLDSSSAASAASEAVVGEVCGDWNVGFMVLSESPRFTGSRRLIRMDLSWLLGVKSEGLVCLTHREALSLSGLTRSWTPSICAGPTEPSSARTKLGRLCRSATWPRGAKFSALCWDDSTCVTGVVPEPALRSRFGPSSSMKLSEFILRATGRLASDCSFARVSDVCVESSFSALLV
mmetsp:Transcript_72969/g.174036  ORF Transcript_72969/g.174036 Transcript_72969/m.174036 type:complete len:244 (+) Transcript_72969:2079-2810(+)